MSPQGNSTLGTVFGYNDLITSFTELSIFEGVTSLATDAFRDCSYLVAITLREGLLTMARSFYSCSHLPIITIPSTMTALGNDPFYNCIRLATIIALPTSPPTVSGTWLRYNSIAKIYVPDNSVSAYKAASGWSTYASRIHGMSEYEG